MSEKVALARNAGYAFAGEIVHKAVLLIYGLVIPRYLGPEDYGIYGYALSLIAIIKVFIDLGTGTMTVREISRINSSSKELLPQVMGMKVTLGFILFIILVIMSARFHEPRTSAPLCLLGITLFIEQGVIYIQIFRALEKMKYYFYSVAFLNLLTIAALPFIILFNLGLNGIIIVQLLSIVIGTLFVFYLVTKHVEPVSIKFNPGVWKKIIIASLPFAALNIIWEIYGRIDMIIIPMMNDFQSNGYYKIATVVPAMANVIPISIFAAIFPYFIRNAGLSSETIRTAMSPLYRYLSICSLGLVLFIGTLSNDWVSLLWGSEYIQGAASMKILCFGIPFMFLTGLHINALYSLYHQNTVLRIASVTIVIDIILDIILIPIMGISGAAVATLVANIILFLTTYYSTTKMIGNLNIIKSVSGPAISFAIVYLIIAFIHLSDFPLKLSIAVVSYSALLLITKSITANDFSLFKDIFKRANN